MTKEEMSELTRSLTSNELTKLYNLIRDEESFRSEQRVSSGLLIRRYVYSLYCDFLQFNIKKMVWVQRFGSDQIAAIGHSGNHNSCMTGQLVLKRFVPRG